MGMGSVAQGSVPLGSVVQDSMVMGILELEGSCFSLLVNSLRLM